MPKAPRRHRCKSCGSLPKRSKGGDIKTYPWEYYNPKTGQSGPVDNTGEAHAVWGKNFYAMQKNNPAEWAAREAEHRRLSPHVYAPTENVILERSKKQGTGKIAELLKNHPTLGDFQGPKATNCWPKSLTGGKTRRKRL